MIEMLSRPLVVGIAGGTGSGKTTVAQKIMSAVGQRGVALLDQDSYYRDLSRMPLEQRRKQNFDHPNAVEFELFREQVEALRNRHAVRKPVYSFKTSTRTGQFNSIDEADVIIVEGILVLWDEGLRNLMDIKIFVETDDDIRIIRRLVRDIDERGRTLQHTVDQYLATVRPMHQAFVEPTKRYADLIIPEGGMNEVAISMIVATLKHWLNEAAARGCREAGRS
jgi:uridine kinase